MILSRLQPDGCELDLLGGKRQCFPAVTVLSLDRDAIVWPQFSPVDGLMQGRLWLGSMTRVMELFGGARRGESVLARHILKTVLFLTLAVSGCSQVNYEVFESVAPLTAPRFADNDPVDKFEGGAPHGHAVHGIDVSKYQGMIDWNAVRRSGVAFAFIKATEGGDRVDDRFREYWAQSKRSGVHRGAYHFYYFCRPAIEQAKWFMRHVPRERGMLPPVLDMEWNPQSPSCKTRPPAAKVRSEMKVFLDALERHYGKRPVIYTTPDFYEHNIAGHFHGEKFWLRTVKAHPRVIYPGRKWHFWQYTGTGVVPGVNGDTDINVFAGSKSDWSDWVKTHSL
jgi:lysozyme